MFGTGKPISKGVYLNGCYKAQPGRGEEKQCQINYCDYYTLHIKHKEQQLGLTATKNYLLKPKLPQTYCHLRNKLRTVDHI